MGGVLEVSLSETMFERIKTQFNLHSKSDITDDHIRLFFWGAVSNALEKSEIENNLCTN